MSGLFSGFISTRNYTQNIKDFMIKSFKSYKIDKMGEINEHNLFMLCGLQFITEENKSEKIPLKDISSKVMINGDIILDNREELFEIFQINEEKQRKIVTDSELVLRSYKKWGYDCPKYLLGDFSFVIYDESKKEIFCVRDHVGCRTFYYYYRNGIFAFSNITDSLLCLTDGALNERWITDFLSIYGPLNNSEPFETIYTDIFQLPPAHIMIIRENEIIKKRYWDPIKEVKTLELNSHKEYVDKFLEIFKEVVKSKIRTSYDVGILVSGGLDSGSVAAIASKELKKSNKVLKGYSFVPLKGFPEKKKSNFMYDESDYVNLLKDKCGNMEVEFCRNDSINSMTNMDEYIESYEQPIKTIQNSYWINEVTKKCSKNNIKVLLGGQFGNATISFGDNLVHMNELVNDFKVFELIDEVKATAKMYSVSQKYIYKDIIKNKIPNTIKKYVSRKNNSIDNRFRYVPINKEFIDKWNVIKRFDEKNYNLMFDKFDNLATIRKGMLDDTIVSHISIMITKYPLKYGVIRRDPTKDKRIIEFCMSLPSSEYVHKGVDRYLIRSAMKGILPEEIRTNWKHRGVQSGDWVERLKPDWIHIYEEIVQSLNDKDMKKYMDIDKLNMYLENNREINDNTNSEEIYCLLVSFVMYKFFIHYRKKLSLLKEENRSGNYEKELLL